MVKIKDYWHNIGNYYSKTIRLDDKDLTVLLGYLDANKWADAIKNHKIDKSLAFALIRIQDETYGGDMEDAVKDKLIPPTR